MGVRGGGQGWGSIYSAPGRGSSPRATRPRRIPPTTGYPYGAWAQKPVGASCLSRAAGGWGEAPVRAWATGCPHLGAVAPGWDSFPVCFVFSSPAAALLFFSLFTLTRREFPK